jgi:hypothetical protein
MIAASENNLDMVKVLLDAKAEVNVQNEVSESDGVLFEKKKELQYIMMTVDRVFATVIHMCVFIVPHIALPHSLYLSMFSLSYMYNSNHSMVRHL